MYSKVWLSYMASKGQNGCLCCGKRLCMLVVVAVRHQTMCLMACTTGGHWVGNEFEPRDDCVLPENLLRLALELEEVIRSPNSIHSKPDGSVWMLSMLALWGHVSLHA